MRMVCFLVIGECGVCFHCLYAVLAWLLYWLLGMMIKQCSVAIVSTMDIFSVWLMNSWRLFSWINEKTCVHTNVGMYIMVTKLWRVYYVHDLGGQCRNCIWSFLAHLGRIWISRVAWGSISVKYGCSENMGLLESALTNPYLEMTFGLRPLLLSPSCVLRHLDRFHLSVLGPRSSFSLSLRSSVVCDLVLRIDGEGQTERRTTTTTEILDSSFWYSTGTLYQGHAVLLASCSLTCCIFVLESNRRTSLLDWGPSYSLPAQAKDRMGVRMWVGVGVGLGVVVSIHSWHLHPAPPALTPSDHW